MKSLFVGLLPLMLAGCLTPKTSGSLIQSLSDISPYGTSAAHPPAAALTPLPPPVIPTTGTLITIDPAQILYLSTSHVIGINRNHIAGQSWSFPNAAAKMEAMLQLTPTWGERKILYRIGHGPTDGRLDMGAGYDGFHFLDHFGTQSTYPFDNAGYPYDDLRNGLAEAATLNADTLHVVNFGTSDAAEAGKYISYLNHAGDSNRAAHSFAQQNANLFELGNEISWDQVRGHAQYAPDEITYATRANSFSQTMRMNSDVPIKIGAVLSANLSLTGNGWSGGGTAAQNILNTMGSNVDFLIYHGYAGWPMSTEPGSQPAGMSITDAMETYFAQVEYHRNLIESEVLPAIKTYNASSGRDVFLANTEFLSSYHDAATSRGMFGALYSADQTTEAINHDIRTTVNFCFSHGDLADSLMFLNDDPHQITAVFRFLRMLAKHWGEKVVASSALRLPAKVFTHNGNTVNIARLQFSSSISNDGKTVFLMVVNPLNDLDISSSVYLPWTPRSTTAYELAGSQGLLSDATQVTETTTHLASLQNHVFKHASITILEFNQE